MLRPRARKALATAAACALAGIASLAFAAWLTDSVGQGSTKVGPLVQPTVTPIASPSTAGCLPGGDCAGNYRVNNTNAGPLVLTGVSTVVGDTGTTTIPACPFTNLSINAKTGLSIPIPTGTSDVVVPGAYRLSADAPNACQGAVLTASATLKFSTP